MRIKHLSATILLGCCMLLSPSLAGAQTSLFARMKPEQLLAILTQMELKGALVRWSDGNAIKFKSPLLKDEVFAYPYCLQRRWLRVVRVQGQLPEIRQGHDRGRQ